MAAKWFNSLDTNSGFFLFRLQVFRYICWTVWIWWRSGYSELRTADTQWRHKSKKSEKMGRCGRQNMLWLYLKIWEWEWIFGSAMQAISSLGVRSPCTGANSHTLACFAVGAITEWKALMAKHARVWLLGTIQISLTQNGWIIRFTWDSVSINFKNSVC